MFACTELRSATNQLWPPSAPPNLCALGELCVEIPRCLSRTVALRLRLPRKLAKIDPFKSVPCALFHFPYPLGPLFATPTKTAGCGPTLPILELAARHASLATIFKFFLFILLRTLLRFFALLQNSTLLFSCHCALFVKKHSGGGGRESAPEVTLFRSRAHRTPRAASGHVPWRRASELLCGRAWLGASALRHGRRGFAWNLPVCGHRRELRGRSRA